MALQGMDGCDLYADYTDINRRYVLANETSFVVYPTAGRFGGPCIGGSHSSATLTIPVAGAPTTYYFAAAMKMRTVATANDRNMLNFVNGAGSTIARLQVNTGHTVTAQRGTGVDLGTSALPIATTTEWSFIEVKLVVHASAGSIEVRRNGIAILNLTSQNTEGATGGIAYLLLYIGDTATGSYYWDDFYHYDTTGSGVTDFLGDRRIETLRPSGDGGTVNFTKSGGSFNYEMVDDDPEADDDTTYNQSATLGDLDRLDVENLAVTATQIDAVQAVAVAKKTGAGDADMLLGVYSGATEGLSSGVGLSTDYGFSAHVLELNPGDAAAWEQADVNAVQLQYEHG